MTRLARNYLVGSGVRAFWTPLLYTSPTTTWPVTGQHQQSFIFYSVSNGATFVLWANGKSATVTYSTTSATTITNINAALLSLTGLTWSGVLSAGVYTFTCATHLRWARIDVVKQASSGKIVTYVAIPGAQVFDLNAQLTSFKFSEQMETVDLTPVTQLEENTAPKRSVFTFNLSLYDLKTDLSYVMYSGMEGTLTIYEDFRRKNSNYFQFNAILEGVEKQYSLASAIEYNITGRRKNKMIAHLGSIA